MLNEEQKKRILENVIKRFEQSIEDRMLSKLILDNEERLGNYIASGSAELQPEIKKIMPI